MLGGADNPNGELPSYITGANNVKGCRRRLRFYPAMRGMALWCFNSLDVVSCAGGAAEHVTMEDSGMPVVAPAVYVGT
ncbi:hypothetical protein BvCms2454_02440 [Escherichia coli]|nr:hypothetical protein BvCms2454_02440 [Escherichia coli]